MGVGYRIGGFGRPHKSESREKRRKENDVRLGRVGRPFRMETKGRVHLRRVCYTNCSLPVKGGMTWEDLSGVGLGRVGNRGRIKGRVGGWKFSRGGDGGQRAFERGHGSRLNDQGQVNSRPHSERKASSEAPNSRRED
eukprot:765731-Hanusia_phi.AAC.2